MGRSSTWVKPSRRDFAVSGQTATGSSPRAQVDLVDRHRRLARGVRNAALHPRRVAPVVREVPDDRSRLRRRLAEESERIGLVGAVAPVSRPDVVLVHGSGLDARQETLPDSRLAARGEGVAIGVPSVEVPDDRDALRLRREDGEVRAGETARRRQVSTEPFPQPRVRPLVEKVKVVRSQEGETSGGPAACGLADRANGHCDRDRRSVR
jgi:hypothetical protein